MDFEFSSFQADFGPFSYSSDPKVAPPHFAAQISNFCNDLFRGVEKKKYFYGQADRKG